MNPESGSTEASDAPLRLEERADTTWLVVDRAEKRNAFTRQMWAELPGLLDAAEQLRRPVVLASARAGVFSAGADVAEFRDFADDVQWNIETQRLVAQALAALRAFPLPTLALVDGPCFGGGVALAVACDFRACTAGATFGITPLKLGIVYPDSAVAALVELVGLRAARDLLLTARTVAAPEAAAISLVDAVTDNPSAFAEEWSQGFRALSPTALALTKQCLHETGASDATERRLRAALESDDYREGVAAFVERRSPQFRWG